MDLTSVQHQLLAKLSRSVDNGALFDVSKFPPGTKLAATVVNSSPADIPRLSAYLAQYGGQNNSIKTADPINPNATILDNVINKTKVYAVELKILGKALITFSEKALAQKSHVNLVVRDDGQLQVVHKTDQSSARQLMAHTSGNSPNTAIATSLNTGTSASLVNRQNIASELTILHNSLKQYLPREGKLADLVNQLKHIDPALSLSNQVRGEQQASKHREQIVNQLNTIVSRLPNIQTMTSPESLKRALLNSGTLLESNLRNDVNMPAVKTLSQQTKLDSMLQHTNHRQAPALLTPVNDQDVKAELLRLINILAPLLSSPSNAAPNTAQKFSNIDFLLLSLFNVKQATPAADIRPEQRLARDIYPSIFSGLAKISSLQIRHLLQSIGETTVSSSGGLFEIPVRIGEQFFPLHLHIQEKFHQETAQEENEEKTTNDKRQLKKCWHVFMEFDLDELGLFASDISVSESLVKTKLWVQKHDLWSKSQDNLSTLKQNLEAKGIDVEELICIKGVPPEKPIKIDSALVDIRT